MILYFSGTGNSEYVARRLAHATGDEIRNLFPAIRSGKSAPLCSEKPWVLVVPTYAWRIPAWWKACSCEPSFRAAANCIRS